ncbi:thioredoxin family protein [Alteribacter populi]|uniref:thioredoxin family protein n=1 Tax=Alteribacter populi TaxID=2011011 RepID=UPI000BBB309C|nr:thioredoxin family protein [Alteribacter populi]
MSVKLTKVSSQTCVPCRVLDAQLAGIEDDVPGIIYEKLTVEDDPDRVTTLGVMSVPTLIIEKDGRETWRHTGFMPKEAVIGRLIRE